MNRGILLRSIREGWVPAAVLAGALLLIESILSYALPTFVQGISSALLQLEFFQRILQAMLGTPTAGALGPAAISAMAWVHPVVLAVVWTHAVVLCTRMPAGEIDRGTIDVLMGLPVSRWTLYSTETLVLVISGVGLMVLALAGNQIGTAIAGAPRPGVGRQLVVLANFYSLYLAVGGFSMLVSAASDRRGRAIAVIFGVLVASFLVSFLAQLWPLAGRLAFLSVLEYYQPFFVLQEGPMVWPIADMIVLGLVALATWIAGGVWFARRDICTV